MKGFLGLLLGTALLSVVYRDDLAETVALDRLGLDVWSLPDDLHKIHELEQEQERLGARDRATLARIAAKDRLAADLIDGTVSLRGAAAGFRDLLDDAPPCTWDLIRRREAGATDDETLLRYVVTWTTDLLHEQARDPGPTVARLESELRCTLAGSARAEAP